MALCLSWRILDYARGVGSKLRPATGEDLVDAEASHGRKRALFAPIPLDKEVLTLIVDSVYGIGA